MTTNDKGNKPIRCLRIIFDDSVNSKTACAIMNNAINENREAGIPGAGKVCIFDRRDDDRYTTADRKLGIFIDYGDNNMPKAGAILAMVSGFKTAFMQKTDITIETSGPTNNSLALVVNVTGCAPNLA